MWRDPWDRRDRVRRKSRQGEDTEAAAEVRGSGMEDEEGEGS
jgi:hypothetical protein